MPKAKSDFTNFIDARPNYFPGQFLLEDDFEIEQKYFIDRQKYHRQSLHVSGIIEGLEVEVIKDKQEVLIKPGSGINSNGDLIVLKKDTSFSQFTTLTVGELYISYREEKQLKQQEDFTRWQEVPTIGFAATTPNDGVKLAKISIVNNVPSLDLTVRGYSGIFLPNATGNDLTLRSGGNANPNVAILDGSLTVTGTFTAKSKITLSGDQKIEFSDVDTSNNLMLQLWTGYGLGINQGTLFYAANGKHSWRDTNGTNERMVLTTGDSGFLTVNGTGTSSFAGNLRVTGTITGKIDAANINSGVLDAARIANNSLSSDKIISLSADKITSGTLTIPGSSGTLLKVGAELASTAQIDLSGNIQLKEFSTNNLAYLQARNDSSNRNIGLRIRTQKQGTTNPELVDALTIGADGSLTINTGGQPSWDKLVVNTTSNWGDGNDKKYVTIGAGNGSDSGIMLHNPHVSWFDGHKRASIRYGRAEGKATGSYWDVGVRESGAFSFAFNGITDHKMTIGSSGNLSVPGTATINNVFLGDVGHSSEWAGFSHSNQASTTSYALLQNNAGTCTLINKKSGDGGFIGFRIDNSDRMIINNNGNVGIGTTNPTAKLEVRDTFKLSSNTNEFTISMNSSSLLFTLKNSFQGGGNSNRVISWDGDNNWDQGSDIRLKTDIENEVNILSRLMQLEVKNYRWKDNPNEPTKNIGFIAQDVQPLFPSLVGEVKHENEDESTLTLKYGVFSVLAIGALRELKMEKDAEIEALKIQIEELKKGNISA